MFFVRADFLAPSSVTWTLVSVSRSTETALVDTWESESANREHSTFPSGLCRLLGPRWKRFTNQDVRRSSPLALALLSVLFPLFPKAPAMSFLASLLPGVCQVVTQGGVVLTAQTRHRRDTDETRAARHFVRITRRKYRAWRNLQTRQSRFPLSCRQCNP